MAYTTLIMENPATGGLKEAPVGFSWTVFFFGFFPAAFRSDWPNFFIILVLAIITGGLSGLYFMFAYNKMHLKKLIGDGFKVKRSPMNLDEVSAKLGMILPELEPSSA